MDSNANLAEQRSLVVKLRNQIYDDNLLRSADVLRLAELVEDLDEWITDGGFLPKAWEKK